MTTRRVVLIESPDVLASVGTSAAAEAQLGGDVVRLPASRSDVLLARLTPGSPDAHEIIRGATYLVPLMPDLVGDDPSPPNEVVANFASIGDVLSLAGAHLVIMGASTYDANDAAHDFTNTEDTFAVRTNRITAGLQALCRGQGYVFVDVDRTIAEIGAANHAPRPATFSDIAARLVTEDVVAAVAAPSGEDGVLAADVVELRVPDIDARTQVGKIRSWNKADGELVESGNTLVRITFAVDPERVSRDRRKAGWLRRWAHRRRVRRHRSGRALTIDIKPEADVYLASALVSEGSDVAVGQRIAVLTTSGQAADAATPHLPPLPVTIDVATRP